MLPEESAAKSNKFDPTPIAYSPKKNFYGMSLKETISETEEESSKHNRIHLSYDQRQNANSCSEHEEDYGFDKEHSPIPIQIVQTSIQILRILSTRTTHGSKFLAFTRHNHLHLWNHKKGWKYKEKEVLQSSTRHDMAETEKPLLELAKKANIVLNKPVECLKTPIKQVCLRRNKLTPQKSKADCITEVE